jgi:putative peptide zinc metalloprotease protein
LNGGRAYFDLVLADGTRVPVLDELTLGRAPGNTVQIDDPSVSRHHARIALAHDPARTPLLEDAGSSYGTWLDGHRLETAGRLEDGSRIRLGDQELVVERVRDDAEAGRTVVVPSGASLVVSTAGSSNRPRLRSGYALKRLEAREGTRRWVLRDLRGGRIVRFSDEEAGLLELLDGRRPLDEVAREAERQLGAAGPARLALLLADLGERGLLAGEDLPTEARPRRGLERLFAPRELNWSGAGDLFERLYRGGGWILFTRPAIVALALVAALGIPVFGFLVTARYGTPFVVARKIGLGGLVFVLGRFAIAALHETAHGLAMASFGRRVARAGFKLVLVFPYVYVETSEIWFEPRRRRIVVSAAGPTSDFVLAGVFSLCCLALSAGTVRDVFFQLSFAAYLGGLFNLNPMLERDGYHILVDLLREPGLRRRAREQLGRTLSGRARATDSPVLARYALLSVAWTAVAAIFVVGVSTRYESLVRAFVPRPLGWLALGTLWVALFIPLAVMLGPPLRERLARSKSPLA